MLNEIVGPLTNLPKTTTFNLDDQTTGYMYIRTVKN